MTALNKMPVIYKYTSQKSAEIILSNCMLRFGRPTEMNDPFDVYIDELFDKTVKEKLEEAISQFIDMIVHDPAIFAQLLGVSIEEANDASATFKTGTLEQRDRLVALLMSLEFEKEHLQIKTDRYSLEMQRQAEVAKFRNTGIFCATKRHDNILMWAHYADMHKGVVLGFRPDAALDSFLCLLEPVTYSEVRPSFYNRFDTLLGNTLKFEEMAAFIRSLTATKSPEWSYEEELRIVIPSWIPEGQAAKLVPFYPHELAELYLGLRVDRLDVERIIKAARLLNPDITIFQSKLTKGAFSLTFDRIV
jgi:Protein of unknown function (DUF2971)